MQQRWNLAQLQQQPLGRAAVLCSPRTAATVRAALPDLPQHYTVSELGIELQTLVAVGGGTLLDAAKLWRVQRSPATKLIAVPTLWGSGAEASPVAVQSTPAGKEIAMAPEYVPDVRVVWPELGETVPESVARHACGDAWSHVLEAFVSPLASQETRKACAELMTRMLRVPLHFAPEWFDLSAEACGLQAASGVGLVHGFAHQLEAPLVGAHPGDGWGHAKLCAVFLLPVMRFNQAHSPKLDNYAAQFGLDLAAVWAVLEQLFEAEAFAAAMQLATERWPAIARDRCTRVNHVLVRGDALGFFAGFVGRQEGA